MSAKTPHLSSAIDEKITSPSHSHVEDSGITERSGFLNKRLTAMALGMALGTPLAAMAETTPPNVPTMAQMAATAPENAESITTAPKMKLEIPGTKGAYINVAVFGKDIQMQVRTGSEAPTKKINELFAAFATPDGRLFKNVENRWMPWTGIETFPDNQYYKYLNSTTPKISFADVGERGTLFVGKGDGDNPDPESQERIQDVVTGKYVSFPIGLPTLNSLKTASTELGAKVRSDAIDLSTIAGVAFPANVSAMGNDAKIIVTRNGKQEPPQTTVVVQQGDILNIEGTTPSQVGAAFLMKAIVYKAEGTGEAGEVAWEVRTTAPETVETPEIPTVDVESLSTNEAAPTEFNNTAIKITIPKGATEVYLQKIFQAGGSDTGVEYTSATPIQFDALVKKFTVFYMVGDKFKEFYFTLSPKADKQP